MVREKRRDKGEREVMRGEETYQGLKSRTKSETSDETKDCSTTKKAASSKETPERVDSAFIDECEDDHSSGHTLKERGE